MGSYSQRLRFIGADGSLGYEHGKVYNLMVSHPEDGSYAVIIRRVGRRGVCPYATVSAFMRNWELVDGEKE